MALFSKKKPAAEPALAKPATLLSPLLTVIAANLAVRAGQSLVRRGVERGLLNGQAADAGRVVHGSSLGETVAGTVMAEVARRSVPGALLVGGGLLAKALRDRHRARKAAAALPPPADPKNDA